MKYRCPACKKILIRDRRLKMNKGRIKSFCEEKQKYVYLTSIKGGRGK